MEDFQGFVLRPQFGAAMVHWDLFARQLRLLSFAELYPISGLDALFPEFSMPSSDPVLKTPAEAANAVVAWLGNGGAGRLTVKEVAETAIAFHSALMGIDEGDDPVGLGLRNLLYSLADYATVHGIEFDLLLMEVEAHIAIRGPSVDRSTPIKDGEHFADEGARRLLFTLHEYAAKNGFDLAEVIFNLFSNRASPAPHYGSSI